MKKNKHKQFLLFSSNIIAGFIFSFSFPPYDIFPLAWFCLIPLIIASEENIFKSFILGLVFGLALNISLLYWITYVLTTYSPASFIISVLIMLLLSFYLSLYWAVLTAGISYFRKKYNNKAVWFMPFLLVLLEYIKNYLLTGFPWCSVGYSQNKFIYLCQIASIAGIYGISFVIVLINVSVYCLIKKKDFKFLATASLILIFLCILWGMHRVLNFKPQGDSITVGIIQGNIKQDIKWEPLLSEEHFKKHILFTKVASLKGAKLIIWPEAAVTFYIMEDYEKYSKLLNLVKENKIHLFFGGDYREIQEGEYKYYNSAFLISYPNLFVEKYGKMHLVPFGEYVPLRKILFFINKLVEGMGDFSPGKEYKIFQINSFKFACMICYEIIFPEISRRFVQKGAELLVTITNDAWFGKTSAPYQHYAMAKLRAIENKRYLVRSANTGISGIINPVGIEIKKSKLFTDEVITDNIYFIKDKTFYSQYGDWLCFISIAIILCLLIFPQAISLIQKIKKRIGGVSG